MLNKIICIAFLWCFASVWRFLFRRHNAIWLCRVNRNRSVLLWSSVIGNVWEWVADCWHENCSGAPSDGSAYGSAECGNRVMRGGSWGYNPSFMRADARVKVFWGVLSFLY